MLEYERKFPEKPNYIHYSRVETILADEAEWLLALFELKNKKNTDPVEYKKLLENERRLASKVLISAFKASDNDKDKKLPYIDLGEAIRFDEYMQEVGYTFSLIEIKVTDFCAWALKLNYNLPDVLAKLAKSPDCDSTRNVRESQSIENAQEMAVVVEPEETTKSESSEEVAELTKIETADNQESSKKSQKKKTKPPEALTEAMEYVYKILRDEGNTEILKPKSIHEFLKRFKEFVEEKGNRNQHPYVVERIEAVYPVEAYDTVKTKTRVVKVLGKGTITEEGRTYSKQKISRRLCDLRKKYPLKTSNSYSTSSET